MPSSSSHRRQRRNQPETRPRTRNKRNRQSHLHACRPGRRRWPLTRPAPAATGARSEDGEDWPWGRAPIGRRVVRDLLARAPSAREPCSRPLSVHVVVVVQLRQPRVYGMVEWWNGWPRAGRSRRGGKARPKIKSRPSPSFCFPVPIIFPCFLLDARSPVPLLLRSFLPPRVPLPSSRNRLPLSFWDPAPFFL